MYFVILFKPSSLIYKLSGLLMTCLLLAGYGVCISSIVYTSRSDCKATALGKVSNANAVIFLILASLTLLITHTIIWFPLCKKWCKKPTDQISP